MLRNYRMRLAIETRVTDDFAIDLEIFTGCTRERAVEFATSCHPMFYDDVIEFVAPHTGNTLDDAEKFRDTFISITWAVGFACRDVIRKILKVGTVK